MDTKNIFAELVSQGAKHYAEEYKSRVNRWQAAGLALAEISDSKKDILNLAYSFLEDHNHHAICSVINWIYPLYPTSYYKQDLTNISYVMGQNTYMVNIERDDNTGEWSQKKYRCIVTFEEAE